MLSSSRPETHVDGEEVPYVILPNGVVGLLAAILVAGILYFAQDVLVPLAVAGLLSFVLSPPMLWLRRHHIGHAPSVICVIVLAFMAIFGFGSVVGREIASLAHELPSYEGNIDAKIYALHNDLPVAQLLQRGSQILENLRSEFFAASPTSTNTSAHNEPSPRASTAPAAAAPTTSPVSGILLLVKYVIGPVLRPLATTGLVFVFVIFFLARREDLRDRFIRLVGSRDLHRTTQALNDAVDRLSRYLFMQCTVNVIYGLLIGLGTFAIGIPNAVLWGALSLVLRFLPYIGTWIAALFPLALSLAVIPGWTAFGETFALFVVVEIITSNGLEPWLFGASAGLSPVAILVAATFWAWLWGPIGLVLSAPLTACLVVIGRYMPPLRFLTVLLGDEVPLAAEESFYQRLLASDSAEAVEQADAFIKANSLAAFYDEVMIPVLLLAQEDSDRGALTRQKRSQIKECIQEVLDSLDDFNMAMPAQDDRAVLLLHARNEFDEIASLLLARLLAQSGLAARFAYAQTWLEEARNSAASSAAPSPTLLCLSFISNATGTGARLLVRRLQQRLPTGAKILIGVWSEKAPFDSVGGDNAMLAGDSIVATSLAEAASRIAGFVVPTTVVENLKEPSSDDESVSPGN